MSLPSDKFGLIVKLSLCSNWKCMSHDCKMHSSIFNGTLKKMYSDRTLHKPCKWGHKWRQRKSLPAKVAPAPLADAPEEAFGLFVLKRHSHAYFLCLSIISRSSFDCPSPPHARLSRTSRRPRFHHALLCIFGTTICLAQVRFCQASVILHHLGDGLSLLYFPVILLLS